MASVTVEELQAAWEKLKQMGTLPEPPMPKLPSFTSKTPIKTRLMAVQNYLNSLEYNYTGTLYFDVNKNRSFKSIVNTAKEIAAEMLPIQCLEAVFLAAYITANFPDLERFPLSFKSQAGNSVHRHIVLAVRHQNKWGALGLSRSERLMYKELRFNSLSELTQDFCHGFESVCHVVTKLHVGFPFPHDIHSSEKVEWRVLNVPVDTVEWSHVATHLDAFAKEAGDLLAFRRAKGAMPDSFGHRFPLHVAEKEIGKRSPEKRLSFGSSGSAADALSHGSELTSQPPTSTKSDSPEKDDAAKTSTPKCPILVAPEELVFKRGLAVRDNSDWWFARPMTDALRVPEPSTSSSNERVSPEHDDVCVRCRCRGPQWATGGRHEGSAACWLDAAGREHVIDCHKVVNVLVSHFCGTKALQSLM
ncbi:hypothetical protein PINS_up013440 [Pythium insidiosum]|nr:hypothetical protein PINS_up013440 [Pythium insidiosum]